jgi:hypothetical protein
MKSAVMDDRFLILPTGTLAKNMKSAVIDDHSLIPANTDAGTKNLGSGPGLAPHVRFCGRDFR